MCVTYNNTNQQPKYPVKCPITAFLLQTNINILLDSKNAIQRILEHILSMLKDTSRLQKAVEMLLYSGFIVL